MFLARAGHGVGARVCDSHSRVSDAPQVGPRVLSSFRGRQAACTGEGILPQTEAGDLAGHGVLSPLRLPVFSSASSYLHPGLTGDLGNTSPDTVRKAGFGCQGRARVVRGPWRTAELPALPPHSPSDASDRAVRLSRGVVPSDRGSQVAPPLRPVLGRRGFCKGFFGIPPMRKLCAQWPRGSRGSTEACALWAAMAGGRVGGPLRAVPKSLAGAVAACSPHGTTRRKGDTQTGTHCFLCCPRHTGMTATFPASPSKCTFQLGFRVL